MGNDLKLIGWEILKNKTFTSVYYEIIDEWVKLLNDKNTNERKCLKFLREHAGFFFPDGQERLFSISEFEFGSDYRADFVVCTDKYSEGIEYEFIELEAPSDIVYTQRGIASSKLNEAVHQINQWKLWLKGNINDAKKILPSKQFSSTDEPLFTYTIIIGRRENSDRYAHLRNQYAKQLNIKIRSYDYLTDKLKKRHFFTTPLICSAQYESLNIELKNKLANPFFKSFKFASWKKIVKSGDFYNYHLITSNVESFLSNLEENSDKKELFLNDWNTLSNEEKEANTKIF